MRAHELISMVTCVLLLGCGGGEADEVRQVAQAFWDASKAGDIDLARTYVSESSTFKPNTEDNDSPPGDVELGVVTVDGDEATVATVVTNVDNETPIDMEFETIMVRENGEWKVEMDKTTGSMMQGAFAAMAEAMGSAMEGMAEGMAEAFKEGFKQMEAKGGGGKR